MRQCCAVETIIGMLLESLRRTSGGADGAPAFASDAYVTDGRQLFRVVSPLVGDAARIFVRLEDCMTLEVKAMTPHELYGMRLRRVRQPRTGE